MANISITLKLKNENGNISEKQYTAVRFPTYIAREIMRINKQSVDMLRAQDEVEQHRKTISALDADSKEYRELSDKLFEITESLYEIEMDVAGRRAWVIAETFGISVDDVQHGLEEHEVDETVKKILLASKGIIEKN